MLSVMAILVMASQSMAADIRYQQSGDWFDADPNDDGIGWQTGSLPGINDAARMNWGGNTVTLAGVAPDIGRLQIGVDESGTLEVNSGGVLSIVSTGSQDGQAFIGNNGGAGPTGTLNVNNGGTVNVESILWSAFSSGVTGNINIADGGTINVGSHLWLGYRGTSTINIGGILNQTGGNLGLGTNNAQNSGNGGGTALINVLDGGLLALNNISGSGGSIQPGSFIDIQGSGQLTIPFDAVGSLNGYASSNRIGGNGVPGLANLLIDFDQTNPGFTTVRAIPEPATLTLLGLSMTGLFVRRRL